MIALVHRTQQPGRLVLILLLPAGAGQPEFACTAQLIAALHCKVKQLPLMLLYSTCMMCSALKLPHQVTGCPRGNAWHAEPIQH